MLTYMCKVYAHAAKPPACLPLHTLLAHAHQQEAKEAAIRDMPAPVGYRRVKLPAKSATRSIVYDHGVRFEQDVDDPDPKKQLWFCACSPSCRAASANNQGGISCQITQTGNITRHLKNHGECPQRTIYLCTCVCRTVNIYVSFFLLLEPPFFRTRLPFLGAHVHMCMFYAFLGSDVPLPFHPCSLHSYPFCWCWFAS